MTRTTKYLSASIVVFGLAMAAAGHTAAQDTSGQAPQPDRQSGPDGRAGRGGGRGRPGPGGHAGPGGGFGPVLPPLALNRLAVTDAQRQAIRAIEQSHEAEQQSARDRGRTAREALRTVMSSNPIDEPAIRARSADVAAVQADLAVLQARVRSEVFAVLTPEQRAQAASVRDDGHRRGRA